MAEGCTQKLKEKAIIIFVIVGAIVAGIIALIAHSFQYVEFDELAFMKRKSTGNVDTSKVYTVGRYAKGPDYTMKAFPATAHFVDLKNVAIFTSDRLEVTLTVHFQYFLRKDDLALLHKKYDLYYEPILENSALDAVKVAATEYSLDEYIIQRKSVEEQLHLVVKQRLGGTCCEKDCVNSNQGCVTGCKSYSSCTEADKGFFVNVKYFQIAEVGVPSDVASRRLQNLVLLEQTVREQYLLQSEQVKKETERQVKVIHNEAAEITNHANAESSLIISVANANSSAIIETARSTGLKSLYSQLNISAVDYMRSFDYLRTLGNMRKVHLSVDFNQLVVGQFGSGSGGTG